MKSSAKNGSQYLIFPRAPKQVNWAMSIIQYIYHKYIINPV